MRKIYKISVSVGIVIVAIFFVYFGVGTYQQIQNEQSNTFQDAVINSNLSQDEINAIISKSESKSYVTHKPDLSLTDILPLQPSSNGDIPLFVEFLREAKETKDITICESLQEPQEQIFDFDDYSLKSPSFSSWISYCTALVTENPLECPTKTSEHPNLSQECHYVLEKIVDEIK